MPELGLQAYCTWPHFGVSPLGRRYPWSEEEAARYQRNSEPVTSADGAVPFYQLRNYFEVSHNRIMAGLQRISPERMASVSHDESTVGEEIAFLQWHETYHVGQLDHLRLLAGKNDKVI